MSCRIVSQQFIIWGIDMNENIKLDNGKGLYSNAGLCDTIIQDINGLVKHAVSGQYIQFCAGVTAITQKVINLKTGIENDLSAKDKIIEELKAANNALHEQLTGIPTEKDGVENGND